MQKKTIDIPSFIIKSLFIGFIISTLIILAIHFFGTWSVNLKSQNQTSYEKEEYVPPIDPNEPDISYLAHSDDPVERKKGIDYCWRKAMNDPMIKNKLYPTIVRSTTEITNFYLDCSLDKSHSFEGGKENVASIMYNKNNFSSPKFNAIISSTFDGHFKIIFLLGLGISILLILFQKINFKIS